MKKWLGESSTSIKRPSLPGLSNNQKNIRFLSSFYRHHDADETADPPFTQIR